MSVIGDMRDALMAAIDTATDLQSVKWDGDPLAWSPAAFPAIGVQWLSGIDSEAREISEGGAFFSVEHFAVLIATADDETAGFAADQAFTLIEEVAAGLNESPVAIGGVADAAVCRPHRAPEFGGNTKQAFPGHGGHYLAAVAWKVERIAE